VGEEERYLKKLVCPTAAGFAHFLRVHLVLNLFEGHRQRALQHTPAVTLQDGARLYHARHDEGHQVHVIVAHEPL
jgi:hypothetical protein